MGSRGLGGLLHLCRNRKTRYPPARMAEERRPIPRRDGDSCSSIWPRRRATGNLYSPNLWFGWNRSQRPFSPQASVNFLSSTKIQSCVLHLLADSPETECGTHIDLPM